MRRHRHDRAGPISRQHIISDPNRNRFRGHGINRVTAREDARLGSVAFGPFAVALKGCLFAIRIHAGRLLGRGQLIN